jgi:hypothetical protein
LTPDIRSSSGRRVFEIVALLVASKEVRSMSLLQRLGSFLAILFGPVLAVAQDANLSFDFRGGQPLPAAFQLFGPEAKDFVKTTADGLRIKVPAARQTTGAAGILLPMVIRGDFEITASYDLMQLDEPTGGHGVGFMLTIDTPSGDALDFLNGNRPKEGHVYLHNHIPIINGKPQYDRLRTFETVAQSGKLRLQRSGGTIVLFVAEGAGDFLELDKVKFGAEDLKSVRLTVFTGHGPFAGDIRIKELTVRGSGKVVAGNVPAFVPPAPGQAAPRAVQPAGQADPPHSRLWWAGVIIIAVLLAALAVFALWFLVKRRRSGEAASEAAIYFPCSGCGTKLKARAELAGKKIKCPGCGNAVEVAAMSASEPSRR